jgi:hypothetical protein
MVAAFYTPPALAALDLTGTWQGTITCKDVTSGAATKPGGTITMSVTQGGLGTVSDDFAAYVEWGGGSQARRFLGQVQELTAKPGQGATTLIACGTTAGSSIYGETLSANVKVSSSSATFKGVSAYEEAGVPTVGGTCKYSLKRISTADPFTVGCFFPSACGDGKIEAGEQCDVGNLNGQTCATQGFAGGTLRCAIGCMFDTSGCYATRYVDNGDGTVTDHQTGLQWEQKDNLDGVANLADPHDADNTYTWNTTFGGTTPNGTAFTDFLGTLNNGTSSDGNTTSGCFVGHCDWRLPAIEELAGLLDTFAPGCGLGSPCIESVFGPTVASFYWSATTEHVAGFPDNNAFGVVFYGSGEVPTSKENAAYVRAVRSGL